MNVPGAALIEIRDASAKGGSFNEIAELCVYGRLLSIRDWRTSLLIVLHGQGHWDDGEHEEVKEAWTLLGEHLVKAVYDDRFEALKAVEKVTKEYKKRDPSKARLKEKEVNALLKWLSQGGQVSGHTRATAVHLLRYVHVAVHSTHAFVLFFSRRFTECGRKVMFSPHGEICAASQAAWLIKVFGSHGENLHIKEFEKLTEQDSVTASTLRNLMATVLNKKVSLNDIREAANDLGITLATAPAGRPAARKRNST